MCQLVLTQVPWLKEEATDNVQVRSSTFHSSLAQRQPPFVLEQRAVRLLPVPPLEG
jgi:hypothetical protein